MSLGMPSHALCIAALVLAVFRVPEPARAARPWREELVQVVELSKKETEKEAAATQKKAAVTVQKATVTEQKAAAATEQKAATATEQKATVAEASEVGASDAVAKAEARLKTMLAWAHQKGVRGAANLEVQRTTPEMHSARGQAGPRPSAAFVARKDMLPGTTVLSVPSELLLWSHGKQTEAAFRKAGVPEAVLSMAMSRFNSSGEARLRLAAGLLALQADKSTEGWGEYLRSLPPLEDFTLAHPSTARPPLLEKFKELPVVSDLKGQQQRRQARLQEFLRRGGKTTKQAWNWAELSVLTRTWQGPGGVGSMLAPVADAIQAAAPGHSNLLVTYGNPDQGSPFVLTASRHIAAGEELLLDYGRMPDDVFLRTWGYTPLQFAPSTLLNPTQCGQLANMSAVHVMLQANATAPKSAWRLLPGKAHRPSAAEGAPHCTAPADEPQKDAYCALALLAIEQCGKAGPLRVAPAEKMPFYRHPIIISLFFLGLASIASRVFFRNAGALRSAFTIRRSQRTDDKMVLTARTTRRRM